MERRTSRSDVTNLSYDGDNHLVHAVKGTFTADFIYDGDGNRIVSKQNGVNTVYIGNYFEWTGSTSNMKRYYYAGTMRVAMRPGSATPLWLFGDHLGSTSLVANNDGSLNSELRYKAWGETRFTYGTVPTTFRYTGQREESSFGLYYYGARWNDPNLSRWTQPDSVVPEATQGVQAWDRFAYTNNNPLRFTDPTGHYGSDVHYQITYKIVLIIAFDILNSQSSGASNQQQNSLLAANMAESIAFANNNVDWDLSTYPFNIVPSDELGGQSPAEYYHFSSQADAVSRMNDAILSSDPTGFGKALHSYQDSFSHIGFGYSFNMGAAGISEYTQKCPSCFQNIPGGELVYRTAQPGHVVSSIFSKSPDKYSSYSTRDQMMEWGTKAWVTSFLLDYYEVNPLIYYSEILGYEVD